MKYECTEYGEKEPVETPENKGILVAINEATRQASEKVMATGEEKGSTRAFIETQLHSVAQAGKTIAKIAVDHPASSLILLGFIMVYAGDANIGHAADNFDFGLQNENMDAYMSIYNRNMKLIHAGQFSIAVGFFLGCLRIGWEQEKLRQNDK